MSGVSVCTCTTSGRQRTYTGRNHSGKHSAAMRSKRKWKRMSGMCARWKRMPERLRPPMNSRVKGVEARITSTM
ncbi:unknown [Prevotella sp. CAG:487]|nr:unknown [Prevotella sp. CAG:487]